ncbi:MAG TPA: TQO small subunit DoxD [Chitinophagaceae bacterium]|nr:TQO small subunit DoxD [Chitinophagaceae bacterium]
MQFLPYSLVTVFAVIATVVEILAGLLLLVGKWTKVAAIGSGVLAFLYAVSMAISFGIVSPLSYSVFTVSAASFLLACLPSYKWSFDNLLKNKV